MEVLPLSTPHPVGHAEPFGSLRAQVTPRLAGSFCTLAWNVIAALPATTLVILFVMLTTMAGAVTVKLSVSDFDESFTEVAVMFGALFGAAGAAAGGVYVTLLELGALSVPHPGEQAFPPAVSTQVTPELVASFCTLAFKVTAAAPAAMVVILLVMLT